MTTRLTWTPTESFLFGTVQQVAGLPFGMNAEARKSADRYVAHGWVGGRYLRVRGHDLQRCMRRLERRIVNVLPGAEFGT